LAFQEYFVHRRWQPVLKSYRFHGIDKARVTPEITRTIQRADAVVFCPSNPFVSIEPILSVKGMRELLQKARVPKIAVSPIVGGEAIKGPAAKMFQELGMEASAFQVAKLFRGTIDRFVLDRVDEAQARNIKDLGLRVWVTGTIMQNEADRCADSVSASFVGANTAQADAGARDCACGGHFARCSRVENCSQIWSVEYSGIECDVE
jgi:LPPG:FO 2-phospho-L-lactate transferase